MEGPGKKIQPTNVLALTKQIVKAEGLKGLYRGGVITILREVPGNAIYFGVYDIIKNSFSESTRHSPLTTLFAGATAGLLSWGMVYPQDILKTRLQCDVGLTRKYPMHPYLKDGGIINCAKDIYRTNGIKGFLKGISACSLKGIIAEATTFLVYEEARKKLINRI